MAALEAHLTGAAARAMKAFYASLPRVPRASWPAMMHGMGYNFEFYDAIFTLVLANVQLSMNEGPYTPRFEAMQAAIVPFCSEFGVEVGARIDRTHRALYADFFRAATGAPMPERYPAAGGNAWLAASRRWSTRMHERLTAPAPSTLAVARFSLAYLWAIERLSIDEMGLMRRAWHALGVHAAYLDAHVEVEPNHEDHATRALLAFGAPGDPLVADAVRAHEEDLAGYYDELSAIVDRDGDHDVS